MEVGWGGGQTWGAIAWGLIIAGLPVLTLACAWAFRNRIWDTRATPANALWLWTGPAFAFWVHPALGVLAALGAYWWHRVGWTRMAGAILWPLVAMAFVLGLALPSETIRFLWTLALVIGCFQVGVGVAQWFRLPVFLVPEGMIHGTLGHRTGYGLYLAFLTPIAFLLPDPWGYVLSGMYGIGLFLSKSSVAALSAWAGFAWVRPEMAGWALLPALGIVSFRALKTNVFPATRKERRRRIVKFRHVMDSWESRKRVWTMTIQRTLRWPAWLIGYGPLTFPKDGRTWVRSAKLGEVYAEAHNDYLEFAYEHGALGVVAAGWIGWSLWKGMALGDPVTGLLVAFAVGMLANFPARVAPLAGVGFLAIIELSRRSGGIG